MTCWVSRAWPTFKIRSNDGGAVRMVYFECGDDQYLVFMEAKGVRDIPEDFDTGINGALGVPAGMYHFALKLPSIEALDLKKQELERNAVRKCRAWLITVIPVRFTCETQTILQVEFCCMTRPVSRRPIWINSSALKSRRPLRPSRGSNS